MNLDVRRRLSSVLHDPRDQGSTGLGLHIVHTIVTNCLAGRLDVESAHWQGDEDQLILPRDAPAALRMPRVRCATSADGLSRLTDKIGYCLTSIRRVETAEPCAID